MPAKSPEEICSLFRQYMSEGDIDRVLSVYDPEAVILDKSGQVKKSEEGLRQNLAPFAAVKARMVHGAGSSATPLPSFKGGRTIFVTGGETNGS
jgi:ketosteroid isomerase-like protein